MQRQAKNTCVRGSNVICFFVQFFGCLIRGVLVFALGGLILLQWPGFPLSLKTRAFTKLHFDQEHGRRRTKATTESLFIKPFQDIECHSGRLN